MLQTLLDSGRYEVIPDAADADRRRNTAIKSIALRYLPEATTCPACNSPHIKKKSRHTRRVIDICDGAAVEVSVTKQTYVCQNPECKKTFRLQDETDYPSEMRIATDVTDAIDAFIFEHPAMSASQIASRFGVGRTVASRILKNRIEQLREQTISYRPCVLLCFIPFTFHGRLCCALTGVDEHQGKYLLNIYRNHSPQLVEDVAAKTLHFRDDVQVYFCRPEPIFAQAIRSELCGNSSVIAILHHCIEEQLRAAIADTQDVQTAWQLDAFRQLLTCPTGRDFLASYHAWCSALPHGVQTELAAFIDTVNGCLAEYAHSIEYDAAETDFGRLLQLIRKFATDNATFDTMVYRLLYSVPSAVTPSNATVLRHVGMHMHAPVAAPLANFGVDLDRLCGEIMK